MDSTESPAERYIASMVDVPVEEWDPRFRQALTTMFTRATLSTQNTTPSSKRGLRSAAELLSTSQTNPVSNAPTSSSTLRSGESLYHLEFKHQSGWDLRTYEKESDALQAYDEMTAIYRFVLLSKEEITTTTEIIKDSTLEEKS